MITSSIVFITVFYSVVGVMVLLGAALLGLHIFSMVIRRNGKPTGNKKVVRVNSLEATGYLLPLSMEEEEYLVEEYQYKGKTYWI
jgi:hypothetical protein